MKINQLKQLSTLFLIGIFLILGYGSDSDDTESSSSNEVNRVGIFKDDRALKDYLISKGEMRFSCSRYGFTVKIKFLDHSKAELSYVGDGFGDKLTTDYTIEDISYWGSSGMNQEFRRSVTLKDGGVMGDGTVVQIMCYSKDPHADKPSFEGQKVFLEDGCSGLSL